MCQIDQTQDGTINKYSCGLITQAMWTITSKDPLEFYIIYNGGDLATTTNR